MNSITKKIIVAVSCLTFSCSMMSTPLSALIKNNGICASAAEIKEKTWSGFRRVTEDEIETLVWGGVKKDLFLGVAGNFSVFGTESITISNELGENGDIEGRIAAPKVRRDISEDNDYYQIKGLDFNGKNDNGTAAVICENADMPFSTFGVNDGDKVLFVTSSKCTGIEGFNEGNINKFKEQKRLLISDEKSIIDWDKAAKDLKVASEKLNRCGKEVDPVVSGNMYTIEGNDKKLNCFNFSEELWNSVKPYSVLDLKVPESSYVVINVPVDFTDRFPFVNIQINDNSIQQNSALNSHILFNFPKATNLDFTKNEPYANQLVAGILAPNADFKGGRSHNYSGIYAKNIVLTCEQGQFTFDMEDNGFFGGINTYRRNNRVNPRIFMDLVSHKGSDYIVASKIAKKFEDKFIDNIFNVFTEDTKLDYVKRMLVNEEAKEYLKSNNDYFFVLSLVTGITDDVDSVRYVITEDNYYDKDKQNKVIYDGEAKLVERKESFSAFLNDNKYNFESLFTRDGDIRDRDLDNFIGTAQVRFILPSDEFLNKNLYITVYDINKNKEEELHCRYIYNIGNSNVVRALEKSDKIK